MVGNRLIWHTIFLYSLPFISLWLGASWGLASVLVLVALLARWGIGLSAIVAPAKVPDLTLDSIAASHFVEKVRWSLDRLGVAYVERPAAGTLGAFTLGRTVPRLRFRAGASYASIGNSAEILRYLYGRYVAEPGVDADFLAPTAARLARESELDAIGVLLQRWVYFHILDDRELSLTVWGARDARTPAWQRPIIVIAFPLLRALIRRSFRISTARHSGTLTRLDAALSSLEHDLADGRAWLNAGPMPDFTDFALAAMSGLWLQPPGYGGGAATGVRMSAERLPEAMVREINAWREAYPTLCAHVDKLYREERLPDENNAPKEAGLASVNTDQRSG